MGKTTIYWLAIQCTFVACILGGCNGSNQEAPNESSNADISYPDVTLKNNLFPIKLDHINIAVSDLEVAKQHYTEKLGFTLKPGNLHQNSILNAFAKFSDGRLIELITASEPKDELAQWYLNFAKSNINGSTFAAFKIDSLGMMDSLRLALDHGNISYDYSQGGYAHLFSINHYERFHTPFFIHYTQSVIDQPKFLSHPNGANEMIAVWLPHRVMDIELVDALGLYSSDSIQLPNIPYRGADIKLEEGSLYMLPDSTDQRVIGVSLTVADISQTQDVLSENLGREVSVQSWQYGRSIFIPPEEGLGIWIEFRGK